MLYCSQIHCHDKHKISKHWLLYRLKALWSDSYDQRQCSKKKKKLYSRKKNPLKHVTKPVSLSLFPSLYRHNDSVATRNTTTLCIPAYQPIGFQSENDSVTISQTDYIALLQSSSNKRFKFSKKVKFTKQCNVRWDRDRIGIGIGLRACRDDWRWWRDT